MRLVALSLCLLVSCSVAFSQALYLPAIVVNQQGDTLKGQIDYRNWRVNPKTINFKKDVADGQGQIFTPLSIRYFEVLGKDAYRSAVVVKDIRSVEPTEVGFGTNDSSVTDTVFLRVLVSGQKLSLYELVDFKPHFYLQEGDRIPVELGYKVSQGEEEGQINTEYIFRSQLGRYLSADDYTAWQSRIGRARYDERDLTPIVIELNGKEKVLSFANRASGSNHLFQFFASAGVNAGRLHFSGSVPEQFAQMKFNTSVGPYFSLGLDLLSSRNLNDLTFRMEVSYTSGQFTGSEANVFFGQAPNLVYKVSYQSISPSLSVLYNLRRTRKVKYYIGATYGYHFTSYSKDELIGEDMGATDVQDNYLGPNKGWTFLALRAGVRLNKKIEIGLTGDILGDMYSYAYWGGSQLSYAAKVAYFF